MSAPTPMKLYLRPIPLLPRDTPCRAPSRPLAGGWLRFTHAELIAREAGKKRCFARRLPVDALGTAMPERKAEIESLLAAACAPRAPVAGLSMGEPRIMGILNVTPDSFSDGGLHFKPSDEAGAQAAIETAIRAMQAGGAAILDVGAESTRPGAAPVSIEEERSRLRPVWRALDGIDSPPVLSIDTRRAGIAELAAARGAQIWNDVSALRFSARSPAIGAKLGIHLCLMHARGTPETMQDDPRYADAPLDVYDFLEERIALARRAGVAPSRIILDPGIGFGKNLAHNLAILRDFALFHGLGCVLLAGLSRKSFIGAITPGTDPRARLPGSLASALLAVRAGVQIVRVHDVAATRQALSVAGRIWDTL